MRMRNGEEEEEGEARSDWLTAERDEDAAKAFLQWELG